MYFCVAIVCTFILPQTFGLDFYTLIKIRKYVEFSGISYSIIMALINFILVGMTVALLFGQLHNVEKITIEDKNEKKYNLLVGKIPHYDVSSNPLLDKKDIILEKRDTYDVLKNLDDGSLADKTLPDGQMKFVEITKATNQPVMKQIVVLISFSAPRLLMPVLVKRRKDT